MNIPRSKNTKGSINETLHGDLHRYNKSTVKQYINTKGTKYRAKHNKFSITMTLLSADR